MLTVHCALLLISEPLTKALSWSRIARTFQPHSVATACGVTCFKSTAYVHHPKRTIGLIVMPLSLSSAAWLI